MTKLQKPTDGLMPYESEALKQLSRTLVVIADMLEGVPLDRVIEDIQFEAHKRGYATKPFAYSPVRNRILNIEKFALALRTAQQISRRDVKCVCGHGYSLHQTPGNECIGFMPGGSAEQEPSYCQCDSFVVHRYEYALGLFEPTPSGLPCICNTVGIDPDCAIHSPANENTRKLTETWKR